MHKIDLAEKFASFKDHGRPKIVGEVDDYDIKVVKILGDFVWHKHTETDQMFLVIEGTLRIDFRAGPIFLRDGEFLVVPKGVEHKTFANRECKVLMVERRGVINTGNAPETAETVAEPERI